MKSISIILLALNLPATKATCSPIVFQHITDSLTYKEAIKTFLKSEKVMMIRRKRNSTKSDPITEYEYWLKTFTKNSPEMLNKTTLYSGHLIKMLNDKSLQKDNVFNRDVIMVLYNLCVEEYAILLQFLYKNFKENKLDFFILSLAIDQDITFSNQLATNYQNEKLRNVLIEMLSDKTLSKSGTGIELKKRIIKKRIKDILSGKVWREEAQEMAIIQPPIMKAKACSYK